MEHQLKVWPEYFEDIYRGRKTAELRKDDRGFKVGDYLDLREYDPAVQDYTGRGWMVQITHITRGGPWLSEGYVMLSFRWLGRRTDA